MFQQFYGMLIAELLPMGLLNDFRYALRLCMSKRGFTAAAALTLAIGIGASTTIFSVINAVLLHPLAGRDRDRLVFVYENDRAEQLERNVVAPANLADFQERSRTFDAFAPLIWFAGSGVNFGDGTNPERLSAALVSEGVFPLLNVRAVRGRLFTAEDLGTDVALVSSRVWRTHFGSQPDALGKAVAIDGHKHTIVGILPEGFRFPGGADVWTPMAPMQVLRAIRGNHFLTVLGRLGEGVTLAQARAEMDGIARDLERQYPSTNARRGVTLVPLEEQLVGDVRRPLLMLAAAVGLMLLIACANVANLLLARMSVREREMVVRAALGATRLRLARQLFAEALVISAVGGLAGVLLSAWSTEVLAKLAAGRIPRIEQGIPMDWRVLAFATAACIVTAILFGIMPALQAGRTRLTDPLRATGTGARGRGLSLRGAIVGAEVALAVLLLAGSGLLIQSFRRLMNTEAGLRTGGLLTFRIAPAGSRYRSDAEKTRYIDRVIEKLEQLPGVSAAAMVTSLPVGDEGLRSKTLEIEGRPLAASEAPPEIGFRVASPGYFRAAGVPLRQGRLLEASDIRTGPGAVVINQAAARRFWPGEDPIGRRVKFETSDWSTIVGVVGDVRYGGLEQAPRPELFVPHSQAEYSVAEQSMIFLVRTPGDPNALGEAVRGAVAPVDPDQPIYALSTMDEVISETLAPRRLSMALLSTFAAIGLLLATIGVYGTISYAVEQRTPEIAIRMALGAGRGEVLRSVMRYGMGWSGAGLAIGLCAAPGLARLISGLLYGTSPLETAVYVLAAVVLGAAALAGCTIPAVRATRIEPLAALKWE